MVKRTISDDELFELANFLSSPDVEADIHAEVPENHKERFENIYGKLTKSYPLPLGSPSGPHYFVWVKGTNKWGIQIRLYIKAQSPLPPIVSKIATDYGAWFKKSRHYRLSGYFLYGLFECGFVLGPIQNPGRIKEFMATKFPQPEIT